MAKTLSLLEAKITNFTSIANAQIIFPLDPGLYFLGGDNQIEPKLGANGSGKSSLWNAIHWCFFGVTTQGVKTSNLVSWGKEEITVIITLSINNIVVSIKRIGPPNKVYINDSIDPSEQFTIDSLLGLNKSSFQHAVLFSQGQRLFPDLSIPERGDLLEEVLNLSFWSRCSETTATSVTKLQSELEDLHRVKNRIEGAINGLQSEGSLNAQRLAWDEAKAKKISDIELRQSSWTLEQELRIASTREEEKVRINGIKATGLAIVSEIDQLEVELESITAKLALPRQYVSISEQLGLIRTAENSLSELVSKRTVNNYRIESISKSLSFWKETATCAACEQPISVEHKNKKIAKLQEECVDLGMSNQELEALINSYIKSISELREKVKQEKEAIDCEANLHKQKAQLAETINKKEVEATKVLDSQLKSPYTKIISDLLNQANPYTTSLVIEQRTLNHWIEIIIENREKRAELLGKIHNQDLEIKNKEASIIKVEYWKQGFKRMRIFLIHRVLAALEIEVNGAISSLGMTGWKVTLKSETETKSGTVKLGVQIEITNPQGFTAIWDCWSGGQAQRLRRALSLGLASLIQRAGGCWYSFEIYDEPSLYLSEQGVEDLLETLDYRSEATKKTIWLVDHVAPTYANFKQTWIATLDASKGTQFA